LAFGVRLELFTNSFLKREENWKMLLKNLQICLMEIKAFNINVNLAYAKSFRAGGRL